MRYELERETTDEGLPGWSVTIVTWDRRIPCGVYKTKRTATAAANQWLSRIRRTGKVKGRHVFGPEGMEGDFEIEGREMREGRKLRNPEHNFLAAFLERALLDLQSGDHEVRQDARDWFASTQENDLEIDRGGGISLTMVTECLDIQKKDVLKAAEQAMAPGYMIPRQYRLS